jgi:nicotinate-nucleotide pyrophosphorylase (carboxylating)
MELTADEIQRCVHQALAEDVGAGDITSISTIPEKTAARAKMVARENLVLAGINVARAAFEIISSGIKVEHICSDGQRLESGGILLTAEGSARAILTAERVALNFVQRLSGVATLTAQFVEAIKGTPAKILDTRKTTPGLRKLEKYAVTCGGGTNHRLGLFDMVLIKDNHLVALRDEKPNAIEGAVRRARQFFPNVKVEVEADNLEQVQHAIEAGADFVLLDNMSLEELRAAVKLADGRVKTEASGGVTLKTVRGIAETGVDFISVGALTHSAKAVDIALDFEF